MGKNMTGIKTGRNAPCPCGSGKKFKQCCYGRDAAADDMDASLHDALQQQLAGQDFSSLEEVQAKLDRFTRERNAAPQAAFHGLSPEQMYLLLNRPFDSPHLASFIDPLAVEPEAPVSWLFTALVEGIGEKGVKATAKGNLPRSLCRQIAAEYPVGHFVQGRSLHLRTNKEDDFYDLHVVRLVAEMAGMIRNYKGRFVLTGRCRDVLKKSGMSGVYPRLLRTFVEQFNWGYGDGFEELLFIQKSFVFSLYLLHRYGEQERNNFFYENAYLNAFPMLLNEIAPTSYCSVEDTLGRCYMLRTFERFMVFFGLACMTPTKDDCYVRETLITKTPLLQNVVNFSV